MEAGGSAGLDLWFVSKGSLDCGGKQCPLHSAIGFGAEEGPVLVKALEPTEIFRMQLES